MTPVVIMVLRAASLNGFRFSFVKAGPMKPPRSAPWQAAQFLAKIPSASSRSPAIAVAQGKTIPVLVEVNLAQEGSKAGVSVKEVPHLLRSVSLMSRLRVLGLMAVPPFLEEADQVQAYFRRLRQLAEEIAAMRIDNIEMIHLSMGMSHDFETAIEEGATLVRIGTAIFGPRG